MVIAVESASNGVDVNDSVLRASSPYASEYLFLIKTLRMLNRKHELHDLSKTDTDFIDWI